MTFDGALFVHMQDDHDVFSRALEAEAKAVRALERALRTG
jgi:hypothetical protein